ncbi:MAG TPA: hypothetical protein DCS67_01195 [Clostridiales bacterium UBA8960]|jgi:hypothetical protein|nr:hypothetical protein [Clostridiales bacterium UBA8960]
MKKTVLKKQFMILICSIMIITSMGSVAYAADDTYAILLRDIGLITGNNGDLMETKNISRVEMIAILSKLYPLEYANFTPPATATFMDVPVGHWGYKYVEFAFKKGITAGKSKTLFGAQDFVNYNQASIFLIKALGYNLGNIQYTSAASEIKFQHGLNLTLPTEGTKSLLRREVFELIVKALAMDNVNGISGIDMFITSPAGKEAFHTRAQALINTPVVISVGGGFYNIYYANGDLYTGGFDGKTPVGNGMLEFVDGNKYIGQFSDGLFSGYGIFIWNNGDFYEGYWSDAMYNGLGLYTYVDGAYQYGVWQDDELVEEMDALTSEKIKEGNVDRMSIAKVFFIDVDGKPLSGVLASVTDETNGVTYNRITSADGSMNLPIGGDYTLFSIALNPNSIYRFTISDDRYMVTIFGPFEPDVTFELKR